MPVPLSEDLRWRAVRAFLEGKETQREIAKRLEVGEASVKRWVRLHRETGGVTPRPIPGNPPKVNAAGFVVFEELLKERPDATREELADELERRVGVRVSVATIGRMAQKAGWTRKKRRS